jgi:hypothetical protein
MPEQAVLVHFNYQSSDLRALFDLEDALRDAIQRAGVGEYDGHDIAADLSDGTLYMYGPDANALFSVARPVLAATLFIARAQATLRYGGPGCSNITTVAITTPAS